MSSYPNYTPYEATRQPFTIGLRALDAQYWIEVDDRLETYLREKDQHFERQHEIVFQAEADTLDAQNEVLDAFLAYLPERYPDLYRVDGDLIEIGADGRSYRREDWDARPLELASRLVQDDLVIMRASPDGHRLVAASLCFPSSWSLTEKFGKALADIHGPVPGFQRGTRIATIIERIFTNLQPDQLAERFNWSIYDDPKLHYLERDHARAPQMWAADDPRAWLRVERQTVRRLPLSGDILFTVKICVDPVSVLERMPDGPQLAASLADHIEGLDADQMAYKAIGATADAAVSWLRKATSLSRKEPRLVPPPPQVGESPGT